MDFYRGTLASRRLALLIRYLPRESALVTELNGGQPVWSPTDHLLADLWTLIYRANADPKKIPTDLDHPLRAELTRKIGAEHKARLKQIFLEKKRRLGN